MKTLQYFNIRNMPVASLPSSLSVENVLKSFADMFMNIANSSTLPDRRPTFKILGLGAPLYRDVKIGASHVPNSYLAEFLQLRLYHVDYSSQLPDGSSVAISQIAKGTPDKAWDLGFYDVPSWSYWLG